MGRRAFGRLGLAFVLVALCGGELLILRSRSSPTRLFEF